MKLSGSGLKLLLIISISCILLLGTAVTVFADEGEDSSETMTVKISTSWDDGDNVDGVRPATITYYLTKAKTSGFGYVPVGNPVTVPADDNTYQWTDLPRYENGNQITYQPMEYKLGDQEAKTDDEDVEMHTEPEEGFSQGYHIYFDPNAQIDENGVIAWEYKNYHKPETAYKAYALALDTENKDVDANITISPEGYCAPGSTVTLTASVPEEYNFVGWYETTTDNSRIVYTGDVISTDPVYSYSIDSYRNLAAVYKPRTSIADNVSLSTNTYTYNGKQKRPTVTVLDDNGEALIAGKDYTVTYPTKSFSIGSYEVTVTGIGDYMGDSGKTFEIIPAKVSIKKPYAGKKKMTVKWSKTGGGVYYEVNYKLKSDENWKTVTSKTTYKTIKKLKSKKYYKVRVRAYKK